MQQAVIKAAVRSPGSALPATIRANARSAKSQSARVRFLFVA